MNSKKVRTHPPNRADFEDIQEALRPWNKRSWDLYATFMPLRSVPEVLTRYYKIKERVYCPPVLVQGYALREDEFDEAESLKPAIPCLVFGTESPCVVVIDHTGEPDFSTTPETKERVMKWGEGKGRELLWYMPQHRPGWGRAICRLEHSEETGEARGF
ncbi:hypothetical protein BDN72DRAFT_840805 [Pluteus cervinus]|uniref:Uncharacterized protein n=1 Tax=Pluteus cervinus TaxID=181527 RepID=A0ACD3ATY7_9AGAR|nr:hypothetical protein BDN72DRAFT_840805 [Pluteus cervinus]